MTSRITQQQLEFYLWGAKQKAPGLNSGLQVQLFYDLPGCEYLSLIRRLKPGSD
jgi:hypothetical protein